MKTNQNVVHVDPELADEAVWYQGKLNEHLGSARQALKSMDLPVVQNIGHRIKGSARNFGFERAEEIGKKLEQAAKEKNVELIKQYLSLLSEFLDQMEIVGD